MTSIGCYCTDTSVSCAWTYSRNLTKVQVKNSVHWSVIIAWTPTETCFWFCTYWCDNFSLGFIFVALHPGVWDELYLGEILHVLFYCNAILLQIEFQVTLATDSINFHRSCPSCPFVGCKVPNETYAVLHLSILEVTPRCDWLCLLWKGETFLPESAPFCCPYL